MKQLAWLFSFESGRLFSYTPGERFGYFAAGSGCCALVLRLANALHALAAIVVGGFHPTT